MQLDGISLTNFKNIASAQLKFSPKINGFLGDNGMGKSNLLDAIHFMSFCKSFTGVTDAMVIRRGEDFAMVKADYTRRDVAEELTLGLSSGRRKSLKRGGKEYVRLSEHIGSFPLVMSAPQDTELVRGSGEERRRWMDMVVSQGSRQYLDALIRYNASLEQRNRMLRDGCDDRSLFEVVEMQMERAAEVIVANRREWTARLTDFTQRFYTAIAGENSEEVGLEYNSRLTDGTLLTELFNQTRARDMALRHTTVGPHRDDIVMTLNCMPMRRTASQGQCKTFTIALRLAQYEFLHVASGLQPLLLLDDIFDKLDAGRVERIITLVTADNFGQIFITDTNRTHLDEIMRRTGGDYRLWNVDEGNFTLLSSEP